MCLLSSLTSLCDHAASDDGVLSASVPSTESLEDTCARVRDMWDDTLAPALRAGKSVLVVSHGNTLRALVKLVDGVSDADSFHLDLPTACPVVYELDAELKPRAVEGFWGTSGAARHGRFLMSEAKVLQAQDACAVVLEATQRKANAISRRPKS